MAVRERGVTDFLPLQVGCRGYIARDDGGEPQLYQGRHDYVEGGCGHDRRHDPPHGGDDFPLLEEEIDIVPFEERVEPDFVPQFGQLLAQNTVPTHHLGDHADRYGQRLGCKVDHSWAFGKVVAGVNWMAGEVLIPS